MSTFSYVSWPHLEVESIQAIVSSRRYSNCELVAKSSTSSPRKPRLAPIALLYSIVLAWWLGPHPLLLHVCKQQIKCLRPLLSNCILLLPTLLLLLLWQKLQTKCKLLTNFIINFQVIFTINQGHKRMELQ